MGGGMGGYRGDGLQDYLLFPSARAWALSVEAL